MSYAVDLNLDAQSSAAVRRIWERLAAQGISDFMARVDVSPHLCLASYEHADEVRLAEVFARFCEDAAPLPVEFHSVGVFPRPEPILFLAPRVSIALIDRHAAFHALAEQAGLECHPYYRPANWVPHCTLAMRMAPVALPRALAEIAELGEAWQPLSATLNAAELVSYYPVRRIELRAFHTVPG
ncbi:MAG TPA: 2'-5' RNA ligase family protein [Dongiaceae bacterium]|jgi:2'-5' RNA ligase|nr:2'-5' RNA ligase family protein [Dongiaceae bacterium]